MTPSFELSAVFVHGQDGYHKYRLPALCFTVGGTLLAFCVGRLDSPHDIGTAHMMLRRSEDGGRTWSSTEAIMAEEGVICKSPCPIVDRDTGAVHLVFWKHDADTPEEVIWDGKAPCTVWVMESRDDGQTWSAPRDITTSVKPAHSTMYVTGPGHGIQLSSGRLLAPCCFMTGVFHSRNLDPWYSHVILSDDHGKTWRVGGIIGPTTTECCALELADGSVYVNCRTDQRRPDLLPKRRQVARSTDGGESFPPAMVADELIDPYCAASVVRLSFESEGGRNRLLFANAASSDRSRMTIRLSYDEGVSWTAGQIIHYGRSGYSDLAVAPERTILCLYEHNEGETGRSPVGSSLALARFSLEWLTQGKDAW